MPSIILFPIKEFRAGVESIPSMMLSVFRCACLCLLFVLGVSTAKAGIISTVIGPAQLVHPSGVAVDAVGNVYVADKFKHHVLKLAPGGVASVYAGQTGVPGFAGDNGPATQALLNAPTGLAVDVNGNLYIADALNHRVRMVNAATGIITTVAGNGIPGIPALPNGDGGPAVQARLNTPRGVAVDALGNLYIADTLDHKIRCVSAGTGIITTVAGTGQAGFSGDAGLATAARLNAPYDVAVDANGILYISDRRNNRIRTVDAGKIMTLAGSGVAGYLGDGGDASLAQLFSPAGLDVDANGRVYVADSLNHRIRMIDTHAVIVSLVGTGVPGFAGDGGPSALAQVNMPLAVVVTPTHALFVADQLNARVRKVSGGDKDWDGVADGLDAFPNDPAAAMDADGDGAPDAWVAGASLMQIGASPLVRDEFPADPARQFVAWEVPFGVNLSGPELSPNKIPGRYGLDYIYPNQQELDYYRKKGFTYIRLPILWERFQPKAMGALDAAELSRLDAFVTAVAQRKMKLILDLHNFARYRGVLATAAQLADFWGRMAAHYRTNKAIFGYGLMNEPHNTVGTWKAMAQAAIDAIRRVDTAHAVIVGGDGWSSANHWDLYNQGLVINDPVNNLLFEAHQYFDADGSGTYMGAGGRYTQTYRSAHGTRTFQDVLAERLYVFVGWLKKHGYRGYLGEFGVPAAAHTDPAWLNLLTPLIRYLQAEHVGWAYWAGGPWWGKDAMSIEPQSLVLGPDRPQMLALLPLMDSDGDGWTNDKDAFASDFVAYVDTDGDGHPDFFNPKATQAQIKASGLILDEFPLDPTRWHVPPIANPDFAQAISGQTVIIDVLANDSDPNPADPIALDSADTASAAGGLVTIRQKNLIAYTSKPGFQGTDTFLYTIRDLKGATATATVTITVLPDSDGDGVQDALDAFPQDPAASVDADGDGFPDQWNAGATFAQVGASPLLLDEFPADPLKSTAPWEIPKGLTLSGPELGRADGVYKKDYIYPSTAEMLYYKRKGLLYIRLPIHWKRLQPKFFGALSSAELKRIDRVLNTAKRLKMKVIIDLDKAGVRIAQVTARRLADFWQKLTSRYATHPGVYGYEILDSSQPMKPGKWQGIAQYVVNTIRLVDTQHVIIVPGDGWSSAKNWLINNEFLVINDPYNKLVIEAHQFFDKDGSGLYKLGRKRYKATYKSVYGGQPLSAAVLSRLQEYVGWLKKNRYHGELGEFGVPAGRGIDRKWLGVLRETIIYLNSQQVGWSYWWGGAWTKKHPLSIEPMQLRGGKDKPQMSVIVKYKNVRR